MTKEKSADEIIRRAPKKRLLNKRIVRALAKEKGITTVERFEVALFKFMGTPEGASNNSPANAWNGIAIDKSRAAKIADFFGFDGDYSRLMEAQPSSWQSLLAKFEADECFFNLNQYAADFHMVVVGALEDVEPVRQIPLTSYWNIEVQGIASEQIFAVLQSDSQCFLLAPLLDTSQGGNDFNHCFEQAVLVYPQNRFLRFDAAYGTGRRVLTVIKAQHIPFESRGAKDTLMLSQDELDRFAARLLVESQAVSLCRYVFELIEPL